MTQREHNSDGRETRVVYNTAPAAQSQPYQQGGQSYAEPMGAQPSARAYEAPDVHVENRVEAPIDRVRWGSILAGLFAALSTLALLSLLGLAIGASTVDGADQARDYGIGAGIWGGLSALLAFLVGGWVAARTAAVRGEGNGMLNGAMVWAVAIPLLLYLLGSGLSALVGAGAEAAGANNAGLQGNAQGGGQGQISQQEIANAAERTARAAWGTLGSLLLALGAASLGGYLGARRPKFAWNRGRTNA